MSHPSTHFHQPLSTLPSLAPQVRLPEGSWMVIDLEQAAHASRALRDGYLPGSWKLEALEQASDGRLVYSERSDMYHVGALLQGCQQSIGVVSAHAHAFIAALLGKQLSAQEALAHPWLVGG